MLRGNLEFAADSNRPHAEAFEHLGARRKRGDLRISRSENVPRFACATNDERRGLLVLDDPQGSIR